MLTTYAVAMAPPGTLHFVGVLATIIALWSAGSITLGCAIGARIAWGGR